MTQPPSFQPRNRPPRPSAQGARRVGRSKDQPSASASGESRPGARSPHDQPPARSRSAAPAGAPHAAQFDVRLFLQTNRAHNSHNLHNNPIPHLPHQSLLHRRFPRDAALNALRRARRNPMRQPERLALAHMPILLAPTTDPPWPSQPHSRKRIWASASAPRLAILCSR